MLAAKRKGHLNYALEWLRVIWAARWIFGSLAGWSWGSGGTWIAPASDSLTGDAVISVDLTGVDLSSDALSSLLASILDWITWTVLTVRDEASKLVFNRVRHHCLVERYMARVVDR